MKRPIYPSGKWAALLNTYMNGLYTILLLILSNVFMTLAWYAIFPYNKVGLPSRGHSSASLPFHGASLSLNTAARYQLTALGLSTTVAHSHLYS